MVVSIQQGHMGGGTESAYKRMGGGTESAYRHMGGGNESIWDILTDWYMQRRYDACTVHAHIHVHASKVMLSLVNTYYTCM